MPYGNRHVNLLAHFYLANLTATSAAGQLLGDLVKGPLDGTFGPSIERGIMLHRAIDSFTDTHPTTVDLRRRFAPPLRRYAGILIDIGFDHCLARQWIDYSDVELSQFAEQIAARAYRDWPPQAPQPAPQQAALTQVLINYKHPAGLQRALDSVDRRLTRTSPVASALPALMAEYPALERGFEHFFPALCAHIQQL